MIKLSIVTPTFNNIGGLRKNIGSILNQSFKNIEHIIVDNLSDDGTEELINNYKSGAPYQVIYLREKDNGIYNAMNKGIKVAEGEWIHILNSDDFYASEKSLELFFKVDISVYDIIANPILIQDKKSGQIISRWEPEYKEDINHYNFPHTGMVIKKGFYEKHGYYNEKYKIISDAIFVLENLPRAKYKITKRPFVAMSNRGISNKLSFTKTYEGVIFNLFFYNGPKINKVKFIFKDFKRDFFIFLRLIKKKYLKNKNL